MTEKEVINELRSAKKPYAFVENMSQSTFSNNLRRYDVELLKPKTLLNFLEKFGYFKIDGKFVKLFDVCENGKILK